MIKDLLEHEFEWILYMTTLHEINAECSNRKNHLLCSYDVYQESYCQFLPTEYSMPHPDLHI